MFGNIQTGSYVLKLRMFVAITAFACSVKPSLTMSSQSLKITLNLSFLPAGELRWNEKLNKISDKRREFVAYCVWALQAKIVSSRLFLVKIVPGLC